MFKEHLEQSGDSNKKNQNKIIFIFVSLTGHMFDATSILSINAITYAIQAETNC